MIIDCHAHVLAFPKLIPAPGATPFMSMQEQIAVMDAKGVDKAVILPLDNAEGPAERQSFGEILLICETYPGRFIPFCNLDPRLPRRPDRIRTADFDFILDQYRALGARGLGELTARMWWDDPPMLCLLESCQRVGFPVTFHTTTEDADTYGVLDDPGLPRLEKVLQTFPTLRLFGHSQAFWSEISGDVTREEKHGYPGRPVAPGGRIPELFRRYPTLHGDLSAGSGLNALKRDPAHAWEFIDEFQNRLLFGFDYCSIRNQMPHIEWLTAARDEHHIRPDVYEKIMWKNLDRVLSLGLSA